MAQAIVKIFLSQVNVLFSKHLTVPKSNYLYKLIAGPPSPNRLLNSVFNRILINHYQVITNQYRLINLMKLATYKSFLKENLKFKSNLGKNPWIHLEFRIQIAPIHEMKLNNSVAFDCLKGGVDSLLQDRLQSKFIAFIKSIKHRFSTAGRPANSDLLFKSYWNRPGNHSFVPSKKIKYD